MKILVTGSEGSLMQAVIPLLIEKGHAVKGVDNFARYGEVERDRDYEFVHGDLTDVAFVESVVKGSDAVIQAAALIYGVGGFHKYPADILSKDIALHQNILHSMVRIATFHERHCDHRRAAVTRGSIVAQTRGSAWRRRAP